MRYLGNIFREALSPQKKIISQICEFSEPKNLNNSSLLLIAVKLDE